MRRLTIAIVLVAPLVLSLRALRELQKDTTSLRDREYAATLLLGRMRAMHDDLLQGTIYISVFPSDSSQATYLEQVQTLARQTDTLLILTESAAVGQIRSSIARLFEQVPRAFSFARAGRAARRDSVIDLAISPALATVDRMLQNTIQPGTHAPQWSKEHTTRQRRLPFTWGR